MNGRLTLITSCVCVVSALWATLCAEAGSRKDEEELAAANSRWRGAHCRTRQLIEIKKGRTRDGWSKSKWLPWGTKHPNQRASVWFSDGDAVRQALGGSVLPPGAELVVTGWTLEPDASPVLELELVNLPGSARLMFWGTWGRADPKHLPELERWTRFDLLEITSAPSEQVTGPPIGSGGEDTVSSPGPNPARTSAPTPTGRVHLNLVAVDVSPDVVLAGGEIDQIITYEVIGVPSGPGFEVLERREIFRGQVRLTGVDEKVRRTDGIFSSSQTLRVPDGLEPGFYSLRVTVATAGADAAGSALFEVSAPP